jgi:NDP-sugar pyrophosphorylase family protein
MKAVILAGGVGSRLAPYTTVLPKPLMPVGDRPILEVVVRQLSRAGFTDLTFAVGHLAGLLQAYFGNGSGFGVRIRYSVEREPLGTAGPLSLVEELTEPFLVMNGDLLTTLPYRTLYEAHVRSGATLTIALYQKSVKVDLGVIRTDADGRVVCYDEKPTLSFSASMGIYAFHPRVLAHVPKGKRLDFPDLVQKLLVLKEPVRAWPYDGYWMDIGRREDYEQAMADFERLRGQFLPEG